MRSRHSRLFPGLEREDGPGSGSASRSAFDPEAIRALATVLAETGLTEIEIADKDVRLRLARAIAPAAPSLAPAPVATAPAAMLPPPANAAAVSAEITPAPGADDASHPGAVLSPMVGIAYLSPEPGAPLFVTPGQQVAAGQTLMLIEAMKTFNQIRSPRAGTVTRILVESGTPVEYGAPLVIVE